MKMILTFWLLIFPFISIMAQESGAPSPTPPGLPQDQLQTSQAHSTVSFISDHKVFYKGESYYIGLYIKLEPEWHTYWLNPGDSASASIFKFNSIPSVEIGDPIYPAPERFEVGPFYSFGYANEVLIQFPVKIYKRYNKPHITIQLNAEWLVCKEECIPGFYDFSMTLPTPPPMLVKDEAERKMILEATESPAAPLFKKSQSSWANTKVPSSYETSANFLNLSFDKKYEVIDIFPFPNVALSNKPFERVSPTGPDQQSFKFTLEDKSTSQKDFYKFLVVYKDDKGVIKSFHTTARAPSQILLMILFGFLGGLILNLMPCVFPVLMLKVFQVLNSKEKEPLKSALSYTFGVLATFWFLALIILILQAGGQLVGWGFQLQSPIFIGFLILLFILMALYFLDLIRVPYLKTSQTGEKLSRRQDAIGAFFTGVLAVIVASPCTAPFMGASMGYALTRSSLEVFLIFTSLGLGLSFPFLILAVFPKALSFLPQPGQWMVYLKKFMALPLLLTAIWLIWVLVKVLTPVQVDDGFWQSYSLEKVESLSSKQPVFVNFTAAWCISCQVNEKVAFQNQEVQKFIKDNNIAMLKADWTKKNPDIAKILRSYNRAGVPLYLFFMPNKTKPETLPEVLTPNILIENLQNYLSTK